MTSESMVLQGREVTGADIDLIRVLLAHEHYLGQRNTVGENIRYLVRDRYGRPVACVLFGAAAWKCADRDAFLGWDRPTRERNLQHLTNNTRFLIPAWVQVPHLASHVLGLIARRIRADWQAKYGHPVHALETFVDRSRFKGTCYRASNWRRLGETRGRTRNDREHRIQAAVKAMFKVIHQRYETAPVAFHRALEQARDRILEVALGDVPSRLDANGKELKREAFNMAKRFRENGKAYFEFITTPGIGPTNNLADLPAATAAAQAGQAVRFVVIDRRITQGTRSLKGRETCERLWTVVGTCAMQGRSAFEFILAAVRAHFRGEPAPSLLPALG